MLLIVLDLQMRGNTLKVNAVQMIASIYIFLAVTSCLQVSAFAFFFQNPFQQKTLVKGQELPPEKILLSELNDLIEESKNGVDSSKNEQVHTLMIKISESRKGDQRRFLPGQWQLIYTTEKEVNFFKTSWPFAKVSAISQVLDLYDSGVINNSIKFEGGGEFLVTGTVEPADSESGYDRVCFKFTEAVIKAWGKSFTIPPAGAGWFDTMFCDEEYRLSRDSRNDWSVFRRLN